MFQVQNFTKDGIKDVGYLIHSFFDHVTSSQNPNNKFFLLSTSPLIYENDA